MSIEHRVPRSVDSSLENEYSNCLLACQFCNRARWAQALEEDGIRLLDPTEEPWADHFSSQGDKVLPKEGDADAARTARIYDMNDPRKIYRRRARRELIEDRLKALRALASLGELLEILDPLRTENPAAFHRVLIRIRDLRQQGLQALKDLERYSMVPIDAPSACRCEDNEHHSIPRELERQGFDLPALA